MNEPSKMETHKGNEKKKTSFERISNAMCVEFQVSVAKIVHAIWLQCHLKISNCDMLFEACRVHCNVYNVIANNIISLCSGFYH